MNSWVFFKRNRTLPLKEYIINITDDTILGAWIPVYREYVNVARLDALKSAANGNYVLDKLTAVLFVTVTAYTQTVNNKNTLRFL